MPGTIDQDNLTRLMTREQERFVQTHPASQALHQRALASLNRGVPMVWMARWAGSFPLFVTSAQGSHFTDADGLDYIDLCLGDTGAMTGHSPAATVAAVTKQMSKGVTAMLPTEDAIAVGEALQQRFGLPLWQFTLSATDANRNAIRHARQITGRKKIVVHDWCYHGTVDETFAILDGNGKTISRPGNIGAPVDLDETTIVVNYNSVDDLERALQTGDVAAVLMEPALTNIGIVLPEPGYLDACRELTAKYGAVWIIDETHTLSVGPGGWTGTHGLKPDMLTVGKPIGGGVPCGAFGMTQEIADRIAVGVAKDDLDVGGIGGTLAGNALSLAAMRATLTDVLTPAAYEHMIALGMRWADGVDAAIAAVNAPWHCNRLGARGEYMFSEHAVRTGAEAFAAGDHDLDEFLHLYALNRGILMTPFHNMALMAPSTTEADVDAHTAMFNELLGELFA